MRHERGDMREEELEARGACDIDDVDPEGPPCLNVDVDNVDVVGQNS